MKVPGPDHPISVEANAKRVVVSVDGTTIADTRRAMTLREADYPPVLYVPRADAEMSLLRRTDHATHCPYKGDASYFSVATEGRTLDNVAWSYEQPYPPALQVASYLAFFPDRVTIEER